MFKKLMNFIEDPGVCYCVIFYKIHFSSTSRTRITFTVLAKLIIDEVLYSGFQSSVPFKHIRNDKLWCYKLRSTTNSSFLFYNYPKRFKSVLSGKPKYAKSILWKPWRRSCFHPGVSSLYTNNAGFDNESNITGKDMLRSMLSYIWPKVKSGCS